MSKFAYYPPAGASSELSVGSIGSAVPVYGTQVAGKDGSGNLRALSVDTAGVLNVAASSLPLPTGAATAAKQDTGNASLASIDGKLGSLGQKAMAGSAPVVIASDQSAIAITAASLPLPTGAATSALQTTGNASLSSIDTKLTSPLTVTGPLTDTQLRASAVPVSMASAPLPSGAATAANQATEIASLSSIDSKLTSPLAVSQSGTWNITNVSGTVSLPTGASTAALQTTGNSSLSSIDGKFGSLGQKAMAGSAPVVIASDQSTLPVSAASLPLPSGAATSANQTTANASLSSIDTKAVQNALNYGAASGAVRVAAQIGNATAIADFGAGNSSAQTIRTVIATDQAALTAKVGGKSAITKVRNDYSSVNVTTGAYVQLIASTASAATEMFIFDSSGQTLMIAFGAAASEVDQFLVVPGGNGTVPIAVPASTRISIKAVSATANTGEIDINLFG